MNKRKKREEKTPNSQEYEKCKTQELTLKEI